MNKEVLHDCPDCGRKNFTAAGLKAHRCKGGTAITVTAEVLAPEAAAPKAEIAACNALHTLVTGRAAEARKVAETACHYAVLLGAKLNTLKAATPHGGWLPLFSPRSRAAVGRALPGGHLKDDQITHGAKFGFSHDTADRYMKAAAGALKTPGLAAKARQEILTLAAAEEIPEELPEAAAKALDSATKGKTLRQLYIDLGVMRAPATAKRGQGGDKGKDEDKPTGDEATQIYRLLCEGLESVSNAIDAGDLGKLRPEQLRELEETLRGYLDKVRKLGR